MTEVLKSVLTRYDKLHFQISILLLIYLFTTLMIWRKYEWHPTSMIHFGNEFVELNLEFMPSEAIVEKGYEGDLGAGYDGQIFYFYSRSLNVKPLKWPQGFDEELRAPRIGYPMLNAIFGIFGPSGTIFGMYFWSISLFIISVVLLKKIVGHSSHLVWFYILSPFSLGSYSVLVSDTVMISLVIISYYFYKKEFYILFFLIGSLAILTREQSLFFYFPLGFWELGRKNFKNFGVISFLLFIPILWYLYLKSSNPNWKSVRIIELDLAFDGIIAYFKNILIVATGSDWRGIARALSKFPLLILLVIGIYSAFVGNFYRGIVYRIALILNFFVILFGGYQHSWNVYENVSRMFAISIPLMIMLSAEDGEEKRKYFFYMVLIIFLLFVFRISFVQKPMEYFLWTM